MVKKDGPTRTYAVPETTAYPAKDKDQIVAMHHGSATDGHHCSVWMDKYLRKLQNQKGPCM